MKKILELCVSHESISIVDAMKKIEENAKGVLFIVDENKRLIGSVSDGDIRRWIIKTGDISGSIVQIINRDVRFISEVQIESAGEIIKEYKIRSLPVVDDKNRLVDIIFDEIYASTLVYPDALKNTPVIIMAGGKGTRLYPYTRILPKPLIPIGEIPIVERIMNRFHNYGATKFFLIINYKKEMIRSYFVDKKLPYDVAFVDEEEPLGTAGGIRLVKDKFTEPVIVTNCDILIKADYDDILEFHKENSNDMTIVSSLKNIGIPYGVLETERNGRIISMQEKPQLSKIINTGMYVMNSDYIEWIPENKFFHMTNLAQDMLEAGKRVSMYPISESSFLDMGEIEEMKRMERILQTDESN